MSRVVVNMRNYVFADAVKKLMLDAGDFYVSVVDDPRLVASQCGSFAADMLLMETADDSPWTVSERMAIRDRVKRADPLCRIVLLVDERAGAVRQVKDAKVNGLIDQFIFSSVSASYLVALLETV